MKKFWNITALWLITGLLFLCPGSVRAEASPTGPEGLSMEAEVGFGGTYRMEYWTPVRVSLENTGSDREGSLEVWVSAGSGTSVSYETPVRLPHSSSKEYTLYVKIRDLSRTLEIRLTDDKGETVKTLKVENLNPVSRDHYFLGLVTDDEPSLGYWKERMEGNQLLANYQPVSFTAGNFPDRREVLDNFSVLILNQLNTGAFRPEQTEALDSWVKGGGILIVGTGENGSRTLEGLTDQIVPVSPGAVTELPASAGMEEISGKPILGSVPLHIMDVGTEGGTVVLSRDPAAGSAPDIVPDAADLVWMHRKGSGVIYIAAFDLGTEPVLSWAGNKLLWENLLAGSLPESSARLLRDSYGSMQERSGMEDILGNIEAMDLPSAAVIFFLFLLYLAMVGPLNYMVLKKLDKREWSWFTIPALSVIFAFLIYGLGYNAKGGELILHTVSVVELDGNSESADLTDYMGIFIPRRGDYRIDVDGDMLLSPIGQSNNAPASQDGSPKAPEVRFIQEDPSRALFRGSNVWTMKTFQTEPRQTDMGSIDSDLRYESGKIRGTVENHTPYPLEDVTLYTSTAFGRVGNIASGEKKDVELAVPQQNQPYVFDHYNAMLESLYPYSSGTLSGKDPDREVTARRRLLENLLMNNGAATKEYSPADREDPYLLHYFAFYGGNPEGNVKINGKQPDTSFGSGVILGSMSFATEKNGFVSIPPGILNGKLEQGMSRNVGIDESAGLVFINDFRDYAVFSVDLSRYSGLKDLKAEIGWELSTGQGTVGIYDTEQKDYVEAGGKSILIDESNLSRYVDAEGMVYLKVQPLVDNYVELAAPTVAVEGGRTDAED